MTIARGLLEFAVADLGPKLFQQVVLARLQRMKTDQASALDEAMFCLRADLAAGFAILLEQLKRVRDRLPPGPAQRGEIAVYLTTLIAWLSTKAAPENERRQEQEQDDRRRPACSIAERDSRQQGSHRGRTAPGPSKPVRSCR